MTWAEHGLMGACLVMMIVANLCWYFNERAKRRSDAMLDHITELNRNSFEAAELLQYGAVLEALELYYENNGLIEEFREANPWVTSSRSTITQRFWSRLRQLRRGVSGSISATR